MQLKKLTLQAFGPFKDKVEIDFEDKGIDKGLLLISGDTGAGKTTIFDAICYALYGQTSGETRTTTSLRSDWASPDIDTFVDLEFYYKDKLYEVRRGPEYTKRKKNGDGEKKQAPMAEINLNGERYSARDINLKEVQVGPLTLQEGNNTISIEVTNVSGYTETATTELQYTP